MVGLTAAVGAHGLPEEGVVDHLGGVVELGGGLAAIPGLQHDLRAGSDEGWGLGSLRPAKAVVAAAQPATGLTSSMLRFSRSLPAIWLFRFVT